MASITVSREQTAFLDRTARELGKRIGRAISRKEVLTAIIEIALNDEKAYDPAAPLTVISPLRREVVQAEKSNRTTAYDIDALFSALHIATGK